jgi:Leucine-rich repeat (LRR) protein
MTIVGVLPNLTSLEVLDLSHNVLTDDDVNDKTRFAALTNLSVLSLANNKLKVLKKYQSHNTT